MNLDLAIWFPRQNPQSQQKSLPCGWCPGSPSSLPPSPAPSYHPLEASFSLSQRFPKDITTRSHKRDVFPGSFQPALGLDLFLLNPSHQCCAVWLVPQSCPTLCDPIDCSPPGSSVHGILQARIVEEVALLSSRGSSQPRPGIEPRSGVIRRLIPSELSMMHQLANFFFCFVKKLPIQYSPILPS